jgi:hypothetical protein
MAYGEKTARGASLSRDRKQKDDEVHHLSVFAADGASAENQKWLLCTYSSKDDSSPIAEREYTDGHQLLADIADAAGIDGGEDKEGRY